MPLTPKQIEELDRLIRDRRTALLAELREDVARERDEDYGAVAGAVTDVADEATADLLSDLDHAEVARDMRELRSLENAHARIADGSIGRCVDCDAEIPFERLRAYPTAVRCLDCQRVHEKTYVHPSESKL